MSNIKAREKSWCVQKCQRDEGVLARSLSSPLSSTCNLTLCLSIKWHSSHSKQKKHKNPVDGFKWASVSDQTFHYHSEKDEPELFPSGAECISKYFSIGKHAEAQSGVICSLELFLLDSFFHFSSLHCRSLRNQSSIICESLPKFLLLVCVFVGV